MEAVFGLIMGTVTASGIPEAIAAAILVAVIAEALKRAGMPRRLQPDQKHGIGV